LVEAVNNKHRLKDFREERLKIRTNQIYELFNLFVRLTKELHSCHVFAITSDSLFTEIGTLSPYSNNSKN
jgi:AAA+ ATPase superfamily predicted ATPase